MPLIRQKAKPVDWAEETRKSLHQENARWIARTKTAILHRYELYFYIEESIPAEGGKRGTWQNLNYFTKKKKVPWGPMKFRA